MRLFREGAPHKVTGRRTRQPSPAILALAATVLLVTGCGRGDAPAVENIPASNEQLVDVGNTTIHYFDFRPQAPGVPILFLHGYSGSGFEAFFIQDDLPDRRIIAPDLPGHGRSDKPDVVYDLSYYLNFVRGFVDALGIEELILVGHSLGGKIAAVYASLNGEEGLAHGADDSVRQIGVVRSLVLIAPYGLDGEAGDLVELLSNTGSLVDVSFNLHNQMLIDVVTRLNIFHDHERIPEDLVNYVAAATFYSDNGVRALASVTRNAIARDPVDWLLPEIAVPTLIIWGEEDRVLSFKHSETFAALIGGSKMIAVAECGHMPHVERQVDTARAILAFLSESGLSSP